MVYIEPVVLERSYNGDLLLAGHYNYQFQATDNGQWGPVLGDSLLGAFIPRVGQARTISAPIETRRLSGVRAVGLEDGGWAVVFGEVQEASVTQVRPDSAVRLWFGILDRNRWATLEPLPMPSQGALHPAGASSLVRQNNRLAWAMTQTFADGQTGIILYEFQHGQWSYEVVPVNHAEVDIAYADSLGLLLTVVQADPSLSSDVNSLLLWTRSPNWRTLRKVVPGSREQVYHPSLRFSRGDAVLTWSAIVPGPDGERRWADHAMEGKIETQDEPVIVLNAAGTPMIPPVSVDVLDGPRIWVISHANPGSKESELRIIRAFGATAVVAGSLENPYVTPFVVVSSEESEVLIAGGVLDSARQSVASLLLRARIKCGARSQ